MSYKLNNSNWQSVLSPGGVGFPVKYGTWQFLEYAHEEEIHNTIVSMIGSSYNPNIVYILWGCTLSTSGGNTIISSGAIFYQGSNLIGEVYSVYGNTITTPSGGNVVVCNLLVSNYVVTSGLGNEAADPVVFTNGSSLNVHNVRTMAIGSGASGSGTISGDPYSNYSNLIKSFPQFTSSGVVFSTGLLATTNVGSPYYNFEFNISGNVVNLSGVVFIANAVGGGTLNIITLPSIARPSSQVPINPVNNCTNSTNLWILPNGEIILNSSGAGSGNIYFDGISFRLN